MKSLTSVLLSMKYKCIIASEAPSGEITHRCSAKFKVLSHLRHLLVRSLTGVLLSLRYYRIKCTFW